MATHLARRAENVQSSIDFGFPQCVATFQERNVLLIEHRDEIFARLAHDLRHLGFGSYRATTPEEVIQVHCRIPVCLTLANVALPQSSVWLTTAKLRLCVPDVRVWLYTVRPSDQVRRDAALAGIERVVEYDGSLVELSDRVQTACRNWLSAGALLPFPTKPWDNR